MRIAVVSSEAVPFAKTGGLADVAGALPKALHAFGHEPILIMPLYRAVRKNGFRLRRIADLNVPVRDKVVAGGLWSAPLPGADVTAYFLEQDGYFDRDGLYTNKGADYPDNCERFVFLARGAIEAVRKIGFAPHLFHVHDWQTALIPPYLRLLYRDDPLVGRSAAMLTIHNLSFQGVFWHLDMPLIGLDWSHFTLHEFEFWGNINLLKGGIVYADVVNTVSPTYAKEIQTPEFGRGLDAVLRARPDGVRGVVNGIDESVWDPETDANIARRYTADNPFGKEACKRALQRQTKLPQRLKTPLLGIVSRLAEQKGLDLLAEALPALLKEEDLQAIVLGDGQERLRLKFQRIARSFPKQFSLAARLDEPFAHRIMAGADMTIVPSRFEPCGLTQMYGLKYGAVPIVRRTGGLADTVTDWTPATLAAGTASGFVFDDLSPEGLTGCVRRALALYRQPEKWRRLMSIGMHQDWSWSASAKHYLDLYNEAIKKRGTR